MHFFDENFWIAVSFVIFLYFAYKPIKKAIINSLDAKINEIKEKLAQTEKIKAETKLLLEATQKEIANFEEYKHQIINKAKISTEKLIEKRTKEMEIALTRKSEDAIKLIENEKSKISQQLRDEFTDTVINLVRSYLVKSKNNSVSDEEIINRFIKQKN
ncbi:ATP synthase subunit b precursor [Candidatus Megaera polyxenophila]|nr:ATP synthase subunit b precursor [Candidatus Megaera polyxenophila]